MKIHAFIFLPKSQTPTIPNPVATKSSNATCRKAGKIPQTTTNMSIDFPTDRPVLEHTIPTCIGRKDERDMDT